MGKTRDYLEAQGTMSIIPVLDLMIGQIVLAEGGQRDAYRPVQSRLTRSSQPLEVAQAMFNQTGCQWLYLADIDSFAGAAPNWTVCQQLLNRGFGLWIDADWLTQDRYRTIRENLEPLDRIKIILSSETLHSPEQFEVFSCLVDDGIEPVFSLDQKGGELIARGGGLDGHSPESLIELAYNQGVRKAIVLDLQQVGTRLGFHNEANAAKLIRSIRQRWPDLWLVSGGGVRNADDVEQWLHAGCDQVLVASAIHDCLLTPDDVFRLRKHPA